jgi:hypothetical protein
MSDTIQTKRCTKCKRIKPLADFYRDKIKSDGHTSRCKICTVNRIKAFRKTPVGKLYSRNISSKYRQNNREKFKTSQLRYRHSEKGRAYLRKERFFLKIFHPNRYAARKTVARAVEHGRLQPAKTKKCSCCNQKAEEYHHHKGYEESNWLDVIPVCKKCHRYLHNSLDTKQL